MTATMPLPKDLKIAIIGLGYVGLPLAAHLANGFGKKYPVTGFDIKQGRIDELKAGRDSTREVEPAELAEATQLSFTANLDDLKTCNIFIVTVPTPVDSAQRPDLTYDAIILAVAHPEFLQLGAAGIHAFGRAGHVLYDVKSLLGKAEADGRL